jgi:dCMP deaminase
MSDLFINATDLPPGQRITREAANMAIAHIISMRGTCKRARVGCVITQDNRIVATGYNGGLGLTHCNCNVDEKCKNSVHAEANAISFAAKIGVSLAGSTLYCTHAPCFECAKLIIQAGIISVVYNKEYTTDPGMFLLQQNGISVTKY